MKKRYCKYCSAKLTKPAKYCVECGKKQPVREKKVQNKQPYRGPKLTEKEEKWYDAWTRSGKISHKKADIMSFIGVFILGWLLWAVYTQIGKRAGHIFIPIIFFYAVSFNMGQYDPVFLTLMIPGLMIYLWAWFKVRELIIKFETVDYYKSLSVQG